MLSAANTNALITRDVTLTYQELERHVGVMAAWLVAQGLNVGDRVASWLPKTLEACLMPLAAARAGLVHVPINPVLRRAQVAHILADCGARLLLTQTARLQGLEAGDCPTNCMTTTASFAAGDLAADKPMPPSDVDPASLCALLYTSGSTGRPKGVMLTHANLWLGAISVAHYLELNAADVTLAVLPLAFDYGQNQLLSSWAAGASVVPLDYLTARDVVKAVLRHQPTTLAGVPPLWLQLVEASWPEPPQLRRITNSGGALTPALIARLANTFPGTAIYPMYGLTEAFRSTYLDPSLVADHPTSMGKAIPFAEILVARPDGSITDDNEPGELVHCGPLVAQGYWQDPERTAHRYKPAPPSSAYGGMAVWSGDTVRRDADGLHYFVGRDDEMIKVSGNRVSPTEVELAAVASGAVLEAVAIGVPDVRTGQGIVLAAVAANGAAEDQLTAYFRKEMPSHFHPSRVIWRDELPQNANGKLDRTAIRDMVLS
jgi:acyl-CoA ligase (AMP-forming) (exosortase A-associated)